VYRPQVLAAHPELAKKTAEVSKLVGAGWKALSDAEKTAYGSAASQAKKDHVALHGVQPLRPKKAKRAGAGAGAGAGAAGGAPEGGAPEGGAPAPAGGKAPKAAKGGPKRPLAAYMHFSAAMRPTIVAANPGVAVTEVAKLLGVAWKALEDKSQFEALAAADKARYEAELKAAAA